MNRLAAAAPLLHICYKSSSLEPTLPEFSYHYYFYQDYCYYFFYYNCYCDYDYYYDLYYYCYQARTQIEPSNTASMERLSTNARSSLQPHPKR